MGASIPPGPPAQHGSCRIRRRWSLGDRPLRNARACAPRVPRIPSTRDSRKLNWLALPLPGRPSNLGAARQPLVAAVTALLARGRDDGLLDTVDPAEMALVLLALVDGLSKVVLFAGGTDFTTLLPTARRAFLDGYRRRSGDPR